MRNKDSWQWLINIIIILVIAAIIYTQTIKCTYGVSYWTLNRYCTLICKIEPITVCRKEP
jgi:hypothetical protein